MSEKLNLLNVKFVSIVDNELVVSCSDKISANRLSVSLLRTKVPHRQDHNMIYAPVSDVIPVELLNFNLKKVVKVPEVKVVSETPWIKAVAEVVKVEPATDIAEVAEVVKVETAPEVDQITEVVDNMVNLINTPVKTKTVKAKTAKSILPESEIIREIRRVKAEYREQERILQAKMQERIDLLIGDLRKLN